MIQLLVQGSKLLSLLCSTVNKVLYTYDQDTCRSVIQAQTVDNDSRLTDDGQDLGTNRKVVICGRDSEAKFQIHI